MSQQLRSTVAAIFFVSLSLAWLVPSSMAQDAGTPKFGPEIVAKAETILGNAGLRQIGKKHSSDRDLRS